MRRTAGIAWMFVVFVFGSVVFADQFKVCPGAKLDEQATKEIRKVEAEMGGMRTATKAVYTTGDFFDRCNP